MADDEIERIEAVFGALSRIASGEEPDTGLPDARCPKCGKADFARVSDLYAEAATRLQEAPSESDAPRLAGLNDRELVARLSPPQRKSVTLRVAVVAIPLGVVAGFVYMRFGETFGELAIGLAIVVSVVVLMTQLLRASDDYYDSRSRWNRLFICRNCGQLVSS